MKGVKLLKPIRDVETRWNSTYDMLCRALALREALDGVCVMDRQLADLNIGDNGWRMIIFLKKFLKRFKTVSDRIEGSK